MVPWGLSALEEESSVPAHTLLSSVLSSEGKAVPSSIGWITPCLLASAEPPIAVAWFYGIPGDFSRGACWEAAVV